MEGQGCGQDMEVDRRDDEAEELRKEGGTERGIEGRMGKVNKKFDSRGRANND